MSNDLIYGVTRGKVMTLNMLKHFLVRLGLHNLSGLKVSIQILSHLGYSLYYNYIMLFAALSQQRQEIATQPARNC